MKARLVSNSITTGNIANDFIRSVQENRNSLTPDGPHAPAADEVLESFRGHCKPPSTEPVLPIKALVKVLTDRLQGMPGRSADGNGKIDGSQLFKGCRVRLRGISERQFIIRDVFWDYEEARIREIGTKIEYVLPWDCLLISEE